MEKEYKKYLTVADYVKSIIIFIPTFIFVSVFWGLVVGDVTNTIMVLSLIQTPFILHFRLRYISSVRKKQNRMIWEAKKTFEPNDGTENENY